MQSDAQARSQACQVLEQFNHLVSTRNLQVLADFVPGDEVLLFGSGGNTMALNLWPASSTNRWQHLR
jgi:hypothetical protein